MAAYAKRDQAEITAHGMDFSKPIDDESNAGSTKTDKDEGILIDDECFACGAPCKVRMTKSNIPYFKEILTMTSVCDVCGNKSTEVKQGGGIGEKATRIEYQVNSVADLNRDLFKSDTTYLEIDCVELKLQPGTLGSMYTTVEGLITKICDHMKTIKLFGCDYTDTNSKFGQFFQKLENLKEVKEPFTIVLDDAASNCFIQNPFAPKDDPQIKIDVYERTDEQNEDLGINDMVL